MARAENILIALMAGLALSACKPEADADPRLDDRVVEITTVQRGRRGRAEFHGSGRGPCAERSWLSGFRQNHSKARRHRTKVKAGPALMRIDPVDLRLAISAQFNKSPRPKPVPFRRSRTKSAIASWSIPARFKTIL